MNQYYRLSNRNTVGNDSDEFEQVCRKIMTMLRANHKWKSSLNFHSRTAPGDGKKHRKSQILRTCSTGREFVHAEGEPWRKCGIFVSRHPGHVRGANWNSCFARRHLSWPFCGWSLDLISLGLYRSALATHTFYCRRAHKCRWRILSRRLRRISRRLRRTHQLFIGEIRRLFFAQLDCK